MSPDEARAAALEIWRAGVAAVAGDRSVARSLEAAPIPAPDRIAAVGKAAVPMCRAALDRFGPNVPALAVTKTGHAEDAPPGLDVVESAHPVPDGTSLEAGRRLLDAVAACGPGDHLLLLVSGGASALAEVPAEGYDLDRVIAETKRLLSSGKDIHAMNAERRRMSRIKGGRLLEGFRGARVTVLAISDVEGDALSVIGSGVGTAPDDPPFAYEARIVAANATARDAAAEAARARGLAVVTNEETLYRDVAEAAAMIARRLQDAPQGVCIWGGEPTVVLPPEPGRGGRNQALALGVARQIRGRDDCVVVVGGTDGTDGPTEAAGAWVDGETWQDPDAGAALAAADSGSYLDARGRLLVTGPTGTNVMDLVVALVR